jgi:hypothetical protein
MSALTTPHDTPKHNYTYSVEESGVSKARKKVSYFCGKMNSDTRALKTDSAPPRGSAWKLAIVK